MDARTLIINALAPSVGGVEFPLTELQARQSRHNGCHRSYRIDPDARIVVCKVCGTLVDAFDLLLELAREQDRALYLHSYIVELQRESEQLRLERNKLRSSVRGMKKRRAAP